MTVQERRAWIQFAAAALTGARGGVPLAAQAADEMLEELLKRCPEMPGEPRAPNRKPRWRREARKAENEARRAASLGKASRVEGTTGEA